jgi:hypothetical protein
VTSNDFKPTTRVAELIDGLVHLAACGGLIAMAIGVVEARPEGMAMLLAMTTGAAGLRNAANGKLTRTKPQ